MKTNIIDGFWKKAAGIVFLASFFLMPAAISQDWRTDGDEAAVYGFQDYRTEKYYDESDDKKEVRWTAILSAEGYDVFRYDESNNPNSFLVKMMLITEGEYHTTLLPRYVEHRFYRVKNPRIYVTTSGAAHVAKVSRDHATVASHYKTMWAKEREEQHNMFVYESVLEMAAELSGVGMVWEVSKIVSELPNWFEGTELPVEEWEGSRGKAGTRWRVSRSQRRSYLTAARVDAEAVKNNAVIPVKGEVEFERVVYWEPIPILGHFERAPLSITSFNRAFAFKGSNGNYYVFRFFDHEKRNYGYYAVYVDDAGFNEQLKSGLERLVRVRRMPGVVPGAGSAPAGPIIFLGSVDDGRFDLTAQRLGTIPSSQGIAISLNEAGQQRIGGDLSFSPDYPNLASNQETPVYQAILRRLAGAVLQSDLSLMAEGPEFRLDQVPGLNPQASFLQGLSYEYQSATTVAGHTMAHDIPLVYNGARPGGPTDYAYMGLRNVQLPNMKGADDGTPEFTLNVLPSVFVSTTGQFKVMADGLTQYASQGIHELDLAAAAWPMSATGQTADKVAARQVIVYTAAQAENQTFDVYTESIRLPAGGQQRSDFPQLRFHPYWVELGIVTADRSQDKKSLGAGKGSILHYVPVNEQDKDRQVPLLVIAVPTDQLARVDMHPPVVVIRTPKESDLTDAVETIEVSLTDNLAVDPSTLEVWINGRPDPGWVAELVDFPTRITPSSFTNLQVRLHKVEQVDYRKRGRIAVPEIKVPGQLPTPVVSVKVLVRDALGNVGQQMIGKQDIRRPKPEGDLN